MNNLLDLMGNVQAGFDRGEQTRKRNALAQLSGEYAAGGDPDYAGIAANGGNPLAFREDAQKQEEHLRASLAQDAALLLSAPPEHREMLYQQNLPKYRHFFQAAPPNYSPQLDPVLQQLAQAAQGAGGSVQSSFVDAQGRRMAIMRDGSVRELGQNAPQNQIIDTGNGYYGVDKRSLDAAPVRVGGAPQQPGAPQAPPPGTNDAILAQANFMVQNGIPVEKVEAWLAEQPGMGAPVADAPAGGQLRSVPKPPAPPSAIDLERLELARNADRRAEAAANKRPALSAQERKDMLARRAKIPQLQNTVRGMKRIEDAIGKLKGGLVNTGPLDQYPQRLTEAGQELEAAVGAIQNSMLSLTRVPGIGSQSDLEARIAGLQYPSLDKAPEVNARTFEQLRAFVTDLATAYQVAAESDRDSTTHPQDAEPANAGGWSIKAIP